MGGSIVSAEFKGEGTALSNSNWTEKAVRGWALKQMEKAVGDALSNWT